MAFLSESSGNSLSGSTLEVSVFSIFSIFGIESEIEMSFFLRVCLSSQFNKTKHKQTSERIFIMNFDTFLKSVSKIENIELPGESSQVKMSPPFRLEFMELYKEAKKTSKKAGVLILFYPNSQQQTHLVLILRKSYEGVHSAQVGFPGGKIESMDPSIEYAAIRETFEEIGIPKHEMKILRPLTELYIPPSNYTVYPFLGIALTTPNFIIQEEEVESVIEVSLSHFLNEPNIIKTSVSTSYRIKAEVPAFLLNGHIVWGATAMMLSELKDLLKQVIK